MPRSAHLHSSLPAVAASGWSFRSAHSALCLCCDSRTKIVILKSPSGETLRQWVDPLDALAWMAGHIRGECNARWVGYLSYDLGRLFEPMPALAVDDLHLPLFCFSLHRGTTDGVDESETYPLGEPMALESSLPRPQYLDRVRRAIDYIRAGDIFQVNLSQRFTTALTMKPRQIWQNLIDRTPAAYGAFLDCGDHAILSNSPELFLHVTPDGKVVTRPIKGTRPNRPGMERELRDSAKDQAELNMIVDLQRNDLGRVCKVGTVKVTEPRTIETHPTVYHGVATIEGMLRDDVGFVDLLRGTFPGGSITGAPKIRAMQIIEELEPIRRGPYCGAIGYLAGDGSMQFNIAIRTMIAKAGKIHIPAGGGIVADSDEADEYEETITKTRAMFAALEASDSM